MRSRDIDVVQELLKVLISLVVIELHASFDHVRGLFRDRAAQRQQRRLLLSSVSEQGVDECLAGNQRIERRAQGVDVAPRALIALRIILLRRRKARFQEDGHALVLRTHEVTGGAEVDQLDPSVVRDDDVLWAQVSVQDIHAVDFHQRARDRNKDRLGKFRIDLAAAASRHLSQVLSAEIFHDQIGGVVLREIVEDIHDDRIAAELQKRLRFLHELFSAVRENVPRLIVRIRNDVQRAFTAGRVFRRHVFLDRADIVSDNIFRDVCNAEAALSQDFADKISVVQQRERRQNTGVLLVFGRVISTIWADCFPVQGHETVCAIIIWKHDLTCL